MWNVLKNHGVFCWSVIHKTLIYEYIISRNETCFLLRNCLNFIRKYFYHCEAGFGFFNYVYLLRASTISSKLVWHSAWRRLSLFSASFLSYLLEIARYSLQDAKENLLTKLRLNERNVNLFTNCTASDSNFNEVKQFSNNPEIKFKQLLRSCLNFIEKYSYHCEAGFGFFESILGIFSFLSFGNSPLFPARCERKSTQK